MAMFLPTLAVVWGTAPANRQRGIAANSGDRGGARWLRRVIATVMSAACLPPATAAEGVHYFEPVIGLQHCCGYYPLTPAPPIGWQPPSSVFTYSGRSLGSSVTLTGTAAVVGNGGLVVSLRAQAFVEPDFYLYGAGLNVEANALDRITVAAAGVAAGTVVPIRLTTVALWNAGDSTASGYVVNHGFQVGRANPIQVTESVFDSWRVGETYDISSQLRSTVGAGAGRGSLSGFGSASTSYMLEPLLPQASLSDRDGNALAIPLAMRGLSADRPISSDISDQLPGGGTLQRFGHEVLGPQLRYHFSTAADPYHEFRVDAGPSIASMLLPVSAGGSTDVDVWTGEAWVDLVADVQPGQLLDFVALGLSDGVRRIRLSTQPLPAAPLPAAALQVGTSEDGSDYLVGIRFADAGPLTLSVVSGVPEPGAWLMMAAGLLSLLARSKLRVRR